MYLKRKKKHSIMKKHVVDFNSWLSESKIEKDETLISTELSEKKEEKEEENSKSEEEEEEESSKKSEEDEEEEEK